MNNEKKVILLVIGGFLALSLMSWFPGPNIKDIGRFLLNCLLCWFLWKGANWARGIMGALAAIACVVAVVAVVRAPVQMEAFVLLITMAIFYGFAAYMLFSLRWVTSHFRTGAPNKPLQPIAREDARSG